MSHTSYLRSDTSNDDDYWSRSDLKGYSFEEENEEANWAAFSKREAEELSKTVLQRTGSIGSGTKDASPSPHSGSITEDEFLTITIGSQQTMLKRLESLDTKAKPCVTGAVVLEMPEDTVKKILHGQPYFIDQYRSREDKLELLDKAIASYDGNAITAAVLLLKKTLKPILFNNELMQRPQAVNQYICYLRNRQEYAELADVLSMLGRTEEAAMLKYKMAISTSQPEMKIAHLRNCVQTHFQTDPTVSFWASMVHQQISLLEIQLPIEEDDCRQEREGNNLIFQQFPRKSSILDKSLVTTLYYCCLYHYGIPENQFASPVYLQKRFQSWLGGMKMKASIGFSKVSQVLHKANAPEEVVTKYLKLIEDTEERLELAKKYKAHALVIETLIYLRDRQALEEYRSKVQMDTREYAYLQDALRATTIKWKN